MFTRVRKVWSARVSEAEFLDFRVTYLSKSLAYSSKILTWASGVDLSLRLDYSSKKSVYSSKTGVERTSK